MANDTHGCEGKKWIGFDLDGTLAEYNGWEGINNIGKPVKPMCDLIKKLHSEGTEVKIVTARVAPKESKNESEKARSFIEKWCAENLGFVPEITHEKDQLMETLYDDRAIQVIPNQGITIEEAARSAVAGDNGTNINALKEYLEKE